MSPQDRFEQLCVAHFERVLGYVLRRTEDRDDATDVTAEVFVVAWRRLDELPDDDARALGWLFGTARRLLANHHRGRRRLRRLEAKLATHPVEIPVRAPEQVVADDLDLQPVAAAFGQLRADDRELLRLVGWEGLDRAQLAQTLGCSRATVRVRLHRARRRFRAALEDVGVDPQRWLGSGHLPEQEAADLSPNREDRQ